MDLSDNSLLDLIQKKTSRPLKFSELMRALKVPEPQRREFRARLKELVEQGALVKLRGGRYGLADEMSLVSGMLKGHPDGYGFLITGTDEPDLYIGRKQMNGAMHQDQVVVLPPEARVTASSDFCSNAALAYKGKAISYQPHPEFSPGYMRDLIEMRKGTVLPEDHANSALEAITDELDSAEIANEIAEFYKSGGSRKSG